MNTDVRLLEPGEMETPPGAIRYLVLPQRDIFSRRADRLRFLSPGHSLGDYLSFLALLADAQQNALNQFPTMFSLNAADEARRREPGKPLLDARSWPRDPAWRAGLNMILQKMRMAPLPEAGHAAVTGLLHASDAGLEETAGRILAGELAGVSPQELPLVSAGLQVYWVRMASSLNEEAFGRTEQGGLCPVCGSHPNVGIVHGSGAEQGLRYLSCSLCSSQWHMVRIKCSNCESVEGIDYYTWEGSENAVKAESCARCNFYLKQMYVAKDAQMDATADDLATLSLDLLMNDSGKARGGPNLLFHPGRSH